ncbi:hypothetical protein [Archangium sp.]|jgi:hypothetical protein|uniref:hypothetical protein n=1 Tax=Archangium sp. TaxID=1872627 RepID=UPI002EDB74DD
MASNDEGTSSLFIPTPIPESQAFRWDDLLTPTQSALRELLTWLTAACDTSSRTRSDEHLSTSLLISGARGSGKTTVLLSAALALRDWKCFLKWENDQPPTGEDKFHRDLAEMLKHLSGRIAWLEPLDLEPLPARANLLATLLVRVRAAIDGTRYSGPTRRQGSWAPSSLLEESAEDTWGKLDQLVRDASFMWEDFPSATDARVRAEQQIKASEIYANFQSRFGEAMEQVARTLAIPKFGASDREQVILVLPIDNVDRSIDHLYNIVKLTRMVTSRRLWFVLAAGHQEFQLFMERSFQKELMGSGQPFVGPSRDETLAIARRQAATTLRRTLPPNYRLSIGAVAPELAWTYPYQLGERKQGASKEELRLCDLLGKLQLPRSEARGHKLEWFADLFNLGPRLSASVQEACRALSREWDLGAGGPSEAKAADAPPLLTDAARQALTLPARTLQDLWHATYREWRSSARDDGEKAVRVATEMLRNAIDESELPAWASQQLHNRIIRQDAQGRIILDLTGKPVSRAKRTSLSDVMEWPRWESYPEAEGAPPVKEDPSSHGVLTSELHLRRFHDVILLQNDLDTPGNRVPMPGSVAGWFMLLHDLLMLFQEPRVLNVEVTPFEMSPEIVVTLHELYVENSAGESSEGEPFVQLDFLWSLPTWDTFIDFALFTAQWRAFLHESRVLFTSQPEPACVKRLFRFILAAWVDNVCSVAGLERGQWDLSSGVSAVLEELRQGERPQASSGSPGAEAPSKERGDRSKLEDYERTVRMAINGLLGSIQEKSRGYDRLWMARVWLEQSLPLLALPEFSPSPWLSHLLNWPEGDDYQRPGWEALLEHWEHHVHRLKRNRQRWVRAVAMRSSNYEQLREAHGADGHGGASAPQQWLAQVTRAWFLAVDWDYQERELEVLKELNPEEPHP